MCVDAPWRDPAQNSPRGERREARRPFPHVAAALFGHLRRDGPSAEPASVDQRSWRGVLLGTSTCSNFERRARARAPAREPERSARGRRGARGRAGTGQRCANRPSAAQLARSRRWIRYADQSRPARLNRRSDGPSGGGPGIASASPHVKRVLTCATWLQEYDTHIGVLRPQPGPPVGEMTSETGLPAAGPSRPSNRPSAIAHMPTCACAYLRVSCFPHATAVRLPPFERFSLSCSARC